jgi:tRNA-splicing ligase RtcB
MPIHGVLSKARVPVKLWAPLHEVESAALDQLTNIANLPFVFKHVAVMPDVHVGKGATVGSVVATSGAVVPAAVGVDIGCGMAAVKTNLTSMDFKDGDLAKLRHAIERGVPVGFSGHEYAPQRAQTWMKNINGVHALTLSSKFTNQLGTLGGGNHFIEICVDTEDSVWIMLHSGSRNFGKSIAEVHMAKAKELCKQMFIHLTDPDLAYLAEGSEAFDQYLEDVETAQDYAAENRRIMMAEVVRNMVTQFPMFGLIGDIINCHHNYISRENHFNKNVIVTRKGAIRAREGDVGIIPGSMGTRSYIVRGLGNPDSFNSCSHGAGRRMSRGEAKRRFTLQDLEEQTAGVECRKDEGVLDEAPGAYKSIEQVMANQADLVEIVAELKQVLCIKG